MLHHEAQTTGTNIVKYHTTMNQNIFKKIPIILNNYIYVGKW